MIDWWCSFFLLVLLLLPFHRNPPTPPLTLCPGPALVLPCPALPCQFLPVYLSTLLLLVATGSVYGTYLQALYLRQKRKNVLCCFMLFLRHFFHSKSLCPCCPCSVVVFLFLYRCLVWDSAAILLFFFAFFFCYLLLMLVLDCGTAGWAGRGWGRTFVAFESSVLCAVVSCAVCGAVCTECACVCL